MSGKDLDAQRNLAITDMRHTLNALRKASTRLELLTQCEVLHSQCFYLKRMTARAITRGKTLVPEHDWDFYRQAMEEEHGDAINPAS